MVIADYKERSYNLEFTRFIFALFVVLNHSFILSTGDPTLDWICRATKGQITFGMVAVAGFFLCGGFYSAHSLVRRNTNLYLLYRLKRLIPELFFVVTVCVILGAFLTTLPVPEYVVDTRTWKYFLNGIMILQHNLPGVFENNVYVSTVNGALWTLPIEFMCNAGLFLLWKVRAISGKRFVFTLPAVALACFGILRTAGRIPELRSAVIAGIFFYIGVVFYVYREHIRLSWIFIIPVLFAALILCALDHYRLALYLCFPYLCFCIWMNKKRVPDCLSALGVYSYAMYLWGFPVQQTVISFFGGHMDPGINFVICVPIVILLAVATHKTVSLLLTFHGRKDEKPDQR